ncbi:Flp pilus assembly complex ATPase component TadA [bacterium]|nr:Flp pilus assembly complex ATPase component TadA [bacterium]
MSLDFGPLKTLIESEDITEVMINSWNKIYVEHRGLLVQTSARFVDQRQFEELIYAILTEDKKIIGNAYNFDGVISKLGYRYNITLPPMSPKGPSLTIRKFSVKNFTFDDLIKSDFITEKVAAFLQAAVQSRLSIVVSGGTGSGKTSFLNTLASQISHEQRVVSIEDVAELRLNHPNWVALQAVHEENKRVSSRDCLINSLRMRPDRIIVGECRKDETFEMLQAMNTGHNGSMTTVHGNSPIDCLTRIESLVQFCGVDLPLKQVRYQMSKAIDIIIQIRRLSNGKRELCEITELTGMDHDVISRSTIFERDKSGKLNPTGYVPRVLSKINENGNILSGNFFTNSATVTKRTG